MRDWKTELNDLVEMALELLAVIDSDSHWGVEEENKLKRLQKIVALLDKVKKLVGDFEIAPANPEEDAEIIARFLARNPPIKP